MAITSLAALEAQVRADLKLLDYPATEWVRPRATPTGEEILDVVIIGGGQSGLAAAAALQREKIKRVLVLDRNASNQAGPWRTFARMKTLRTRPELTGPCLGIPSLTVQHWWEAQHGAGSYASLKLLPTEAWAQYLDWYQQVLSLPVRAETEAGPLRWVEALRCFEVPFTSATARGCVLARRVIVATGIEGSGAWLVPSFIAKALPKTRYSHTCEAIDFEALRGKRIAVLGAGASAFDNAVVALEHGASVEQFVRRPEITRCKSPFHWAEFSGFMMQYARLPDSQKYRFMRKFAEMGQPATYTAQEALSFEAFTLHTGEGWQAVEDGVDGVVVETRQRRYTFDYLILGTGYATDLSTRPLYQNILGDLALWRDKYQPKTSDSIDQELLRHPYLGPNFEHVAKTEGRAPFVGYVFNYTFGGLASNGLPGGSIAGLRYSVDRLVAGVVGSIFEEDTGALWDDLVAAAAVPIYPKLG